MIISEIGINERIPSNILIKMLYPGKEIYEQAHNPNIPDKITLTAVIP